MIHLVHVRKTGHWYVAVGKTVLTTAFGNDIEAIDWAEDMGWAEFGWEATQELTEQPDRSVTRS